MEMAYNPNDCMEIRWGAPEGSAGDAVMSGGTRRAAQRAKMAEYREWFRTRHRPPR